VKVKAASVNYGDLLARKFRFVTRKEFDMLGIFWLLAKVSFGLKKPKITVLGNEFSGIVESVGINVSNFKLGESVFGYLGQNMGAYAEYITIPEKGVLATKPENITYEEAAVIPYGAVMAMNIKPGQKVLIIGASGGIGSFAVQIAKNSGAEVTGVCSTHRVEYVKSLGADKVIDYSNEDFTRNGETYDLIFDVLGRSSFSGCKRSLKPAGQILYASFKTQKLLQSIWNRKMVCAIAPGSVEDFLLVKELIDAGKIKAGLDKIYSMDQAAQAHRYVEEGKSHGKIAIRIN
jgi:NADPH:quinone reductase-like Zn-dependent oxidoreductase